MRIRTAAWIALFGIILYTCMSFWEVAEAAGMYRAIHQALGSQDAYLVYRATKLALRVILLCGSLIVFLCPFLARRPPGGVVDILPIAAPQPPIAGPPYSSPPQGRM